MLWTVGHWQASLSLLPSLLFFTVNISSVQTVSSNNNTEWKCHKPAITSTILHPVSIMKTKPLFLGTQVSMTTPGCVTARSPWWCHSPCLWAVLLFSWTSCWCAAGLWVSRGCCWPRPSCPVVWGRLSSLQPPESYLLWAAMSSSAVMLLVTQHQLWPGSKPQLVLVRIPGSVSGGELMLVNTESQLSHNVVTWSFLQIAANRTSLTAQNSYLGIWRVVSWTSLSHCCRHINIYVSYIVSLIAYQPAFHRQLSRVMLEQ